MSRIGWLAGATIATVGIWAVASSSAERPSEQKDVAVVAEPDIGVPARLSLSSGSALSTAAFGMSALQPETYNGDIVKDIIKASPLTPGEKLRLKDDLKAAEAGRIDLSDALSNVRIALAVE